MAALKGARRPLLLFPCNGTAIEALDALEALPDVWECLGFVDDAPGRRSSLCFGLPVHDRSAFTRWPGALVLAVPGSPTSFRARRADITSLALDPSRFATVVHPSAHVSRHARLGRNVLVMAGAVITSNAVVGDHVCVLPNTVVHHDAVIEAWSLVGSNVTVAGGVRIGENSYIGSGSSVKNGVQLAQGCLVGLGSTVIADVLVPGSMVAGSPAKGLRVRIDLPSELGARGPGSLF